MRLKCRVEGGLNLKFFNNSFFFLTEGIEYFKKKQVTFKIYTHWDLFLFKLFQIKAQISVRCTIINNNPTLRTPHHQQRL